MLANFSAHLPKHLALAVLVLGLAAACSGHTDTGEGRGGDSGAGGSAAGTKATTAGTSGAPLTPGVAGSDPVGARGGESTTGGTTQQPLNGAAFFDFDCSSDGKLPPGDACAVCEQTQCKDELASALGDNWSSGQADGPCKAWFDCLQACTCNDQPCYKSCTSKLSEGNCPTAFAPFDACLGDTCHSSCSSSSSG